VIRDGSIDRPLADNDLGRAAVGVPRHHINPAITLALAVKRNFPWAKVLPCHLQLRDGQAHRAGNPRRGADSTPTFSIFATFPAPLLIGFAVAAIGMSFGANAGYAINPARDFGPACWPGWAAGGTVAFPGAHWYFWVPIVGP
jgi:glycerol uptake facilitator protein